MKENKTIGRDLHENMFLEMKEKEIFEQAKKYAFEYADEVPERNVFPTEQALNNLEKFNENFPGYSSAPADILNQLHQYGSPATIPHIGGRYFGLVHGGVVPVALAVKWLSDFWDQNTPLYATSPLASKLESIVEEWLKELFHLPEETVAGFVSGTSMGTLSGLAAARYRILKRMNWDVNAKGLFNAPPIKVIASRQAHGTVLKATAILGFGNDNVHLVDADSQGRIRPELIPELDDKTILILQAGNVNSGAFDDFENICNKARKANAWVHIDGAFGLWAAGAKKLEHLTKGIEKANSWSVDGHKTLNTPYDCGMILCNDKDALVSALQASGSYIIYSDKRDGMLCTPEMSRRARVVELWATLKYLGKAGVDDLVYGLHARAVQFSKELLENRFLIHNDVVFNQVLVSCGDDKLTQQTLTELQNLRECWCGGAVWNDQKVIRISVCSWATTQEDISRSVRAFVKARNIATIRT